MDKKPLIGVSICAVILLVLGSLSNVVGYQSVKSSTVNDSPLFSMRTQRATNQQQNIITSQYLGKGIGNRLQFPTKDNSTDLLKRVIAYINKMDDATFNAFIVFVINRLQQNHQITYETTREIRILLKQLRNEPLLLHHINHQNLDSNARYATEFCQTTQCLTTFPYIALCIVFYLFTICLAIFVIIDFAIIEPFITVLLNCPG